MGKVFKYFKAREWLLVVLCAAFVVVQVYSELKMPEYTKAITAAIQAPEPSVREVWMNGLFMLLCALGSAGCLLIVGLFAALLGARIAKRMREEIYAHVTELSLADVNKFSIATLITRSTNDVTQVQALFALGAQYLFRAPIMSVWAVVKIVKYDWRYSTMTGIAIVVMLVVGLIVILFALPKFKKIQLLTDDVNRIMREQLTGVRVVRAYNAEQYAESKFGTANDELTKTNIAVNRAFVTINPLINVVMYGVSIGVFWIGCIIVNNAMGAAKLDAFSDMMALTSYVLQVLSGFLMLVVTFIMTPRALIAARRITEVLDVPPSVVDPASPAPAPEKDGTVEFRNVSFRYPDAGEYALKNITFEAKRGETVAFIGSTGSGKTTLVNLVPRFYDVTEGEVLVDGMDVREFTQKELRSRIGYVQQKSTLFSGTLAENVNFGDGAAERTEADIRKALEVAQADFVDDMDGGLNAHIAQNGTNVSGGQRQRIAIARAVCKNPEIYIFDDSFSARDFKTDRALRAALKTHAAGATSLIVAQRVGTIMDADKIVVLDDGKQVGVGTHAELMGTCEVYREIALSQLSEEELNNA